MVKEVKVESSGSEELVSLTLADYYNFCVNNGILVHNSMFAVLCTVFNGVVCPVFQYLVTAAIVANYRNKSDIEAQTEICRNADFVGREVACAKTLSGPGIFGQAQSPTYPTFSEQKQDANYQSCSFTGTAATAAAGAGIGFSISTSTFTAGVSAAVAVILYKLAKTFIWPEKSPEEKARKIEAQWRETFDEMKRLKDRRTKLAEEIQTKAREEIIGNTIARCEQLVMEAERLAPVRDAEARAWQKAQLEKNENPEPVNNSESTSETEQEPLVTNEGGDPEDPEDEDPKKSKGKWKLENWRQSLRRAERAWRNLVKRAHKLMDEGDKDLAKLVQDAADKLRKSIDAAKVSGKTYTTIASFSVTYGLGTKFLDCLEATESFYGFARNGPARIFVVKEVFEKWALKIGDYIYFDLSHDLGLNHIEVFGKTLDGVKIIARTVLDLVGEILKTKEIQAIEQLRTLHEWIVEK